MGALTVEEWVRNNRRLLLLQRGFYDARREGNRGKARQYLRWMQKFWGL